MQERAIDLYRVEVDQAQPGQAGKAGAEIVEPDPDAEHLEVADAAQYVGVHLHFQPFGDLEGQAVSGDTRFGQDRGDGSRKARRPQLYRRDVDADEADMVVEDELVADGADRPAAEFQDGPRPFRHRDEQARRHRGAVQHPQPHQRLDRFQPARIDVLDRLVDHRDEVLVDGDLQQRRDVLAFVAALRVRWVEQAHAVAATRLGQVERPIGLVDDLLELRPGLAAGKGGADAHRDDRHAVAALFVHDGQVLHRAPDRLGKQRYLLLPVHARQHDELLAAIAPDRGIVLLDGGAERVGHLHQAAVAFLVAVAVVEFLEEVDVDENRDEAAAQQLPVAPVVAQPLVDRAPVFQPRQRIGTRQPEQGLATLGRLLLLVPGLQRVQEDIVALDVQLPVHIGGEGEARDVERAEHQPVGAARWKVVQRQEERRQHDAGRNDRETEAEAEEQVGAHHEDRAEHHVV